MKASKTCYVKEGNLDKLYVMFLRCLEYIKAWLFFGGNKTLIKFGLLRYIFILTLCMWYLHWVENKLMTEWSSGLCVGVLKFQGSFHISRSIWDANKWHPYLVTNSTKIGIFIVGLYPWYLLSKHWICIQKMKTYFIPWTIGSDMHLRDWGGGHGFGEVFCILSHLKSYLDQF